MVLAATATTGAGCQKWSRPNWFSRTKSLQPVSGRTNCGRICAWRWKPRKHHNSPGVVCSSTWLRRTGQGKDGVNRIQVMIDDWYWYDYWWDCKLLLRNVETDGATHCPGARYRETTWQRRWRFRTDEFGGPKLLRQSPIPMFFFEKNSFNQIEMAWATELSQLSFVDKHLWFMFMVLHHSFPVDPDIWLSESTSWCYRSWSWWIRFGVYLWGCHRPCFLLPHCACRKYGDPWFDMFDCLTFSLGVQRDLGSETWTLSIVSWISWIGLNYVWKVQWHYPNSFSKAVTTTSRNNGAAPPCQGLIPAVPAVKEATLQQSAARDDNNGIR